MTDTAASDQPGLPAQFADLEHFVAKWDQPDTNARYEVRRSSSMAELTEFYDAMMKRGEEIKTYLDSKAFADFTEADNRLGRLMFALAMAAQSAEIYHSVLVPDTGSASLDCVHEPDLPHL